MRLRKFCINLLRRPDRRNRVKSEFEKNNIKDVEFFDAVDGKNLHATENIVRMFLFNDFEYRSGIIGCALSHYLLYKQLISDEDSDLYLIFEDDIEILPNFNENCDTILKQVGLNFDILFIGNHGYDKTQIGTPVRLETFNNYGAGGTFGYIFTKKFAIRIVNAIEKYSIKYAIDTYIQKYCACEQILVHVSVPPLVTAPTSVANSDIQTSFSSISGLNNFKYLYDKYKINGYKFITNLDFVENNICYVPHTSINDIKKKADETENCVAFNTYGFLKHGFNRPIDNMYTDYKINGIYIKNDKL